MPNRNSLIYVAALAAAGAYAYAVSAARGYTAANIAWFCWAASLASIPFFWALHQASYFLEAREIIASRKSRDLSWIRHPGAYVLLSAVYAAASFYGLTLLGSFLAIVAPQDPADVFSPDGYRKQSAVALAWDIVGRDAKLLPAFLGLKFSLLPATPIDRARAGYVKETLLALSGCFLATLAVRWGQAHAVAADGRLLSLQIVLIWLFFPWSLVVGRDLRGKSYNRLAEYSVPVSSPVEYSHGPAQYFWGGVFLLAAIAFLVILTRAAWLVCVAGHAPTIGKFIVVAFMAVLGTSFFAAFSFAGMNMMFSRTRVSIVGSEVDFRERGFLVFLPKIRQFREPLTRYRAIEQREEISSGADTTTTCAYAVYLKHADDRRKDVGLYRAYHDDDYGEIAARWARLLSLPVVKTQTNA